MKKSLLILAVVLAPALASAETFNTTSQVTTGTTVSQDTALTFGTINHILGASTDTVITLDNANGTTVSGGSGDTVAVNTAKTGMFTVNGSGSGTVTMSITNATLAGTNGNTATLTTNLAVDGGNTVTLTTGAANIKVTGTLTVPKAAIADTYTGSYNITAQA